MGGMTRISSQSPAGRGDRVAPGRRRDRRPPRPSAAAVPIEPIEPVSRAEPARGAAAQVSLIVAAVVAVVGAGLVAVLVAGLVDGVRGTGPVLLAALAVGVFGLAWRLFAMSRAARTRPASRGPQPRPRQDRRTPAL